MKRIYRDQEIRHAVLAISTAIKRATFQGNEQTALHLATLLHRAEPLEARTAHDRDGFLIIIAYTYSVLRDQAQALQNAHNACARFPDDALLTHILALLSL